MLWPKGQRLQIGTAHRLPLLVSTSVIIATLLLWYALVVHEHSEIKRTVHSAATNVRSEVSLRVDTRVFALVRVAQRWAYAGAPPQAQWEFEAELNFQQFPGYQAILWVTPELQARWLVSRNTEETLQSLRVASTQYSETVLAAVQDQNTVIATPAIELAAKKKGFVVYVPLVVHNQNFEGFIVGIFAFQELLDAILKNIAPGYALALFDGPQEIYRRDPSDSRTEKDWSQETAVNPYGITWRVRIWPLPEELAARQSALPELTLGAGVAMALLLAWMVALAQTARARTRDLEETNYELNQEIAVRQRLTEELENARSELELRVQERTAELARANTDLRRENVERRRAETGLARQAQELARSNRELEQFAYVASHDLQEPLRKLLAFGDRLKITAGQELSGQSRGYVERMHAAATRMQTLITDLLTLSRVMTRPQPFVSVNLAEVAQTVVSDMEVRIQQVHGHVSLNQLPTIEADPLQMSQLLQNLIGNALKFSREGHPPVVKVWGKLIYNVEHETPTQDVTPQHCQIWVEDNGIGFDEKYLDRIFEPFQRLHGRGEYEGTGMGLAICRKIVERHGGAITAQSAPGRGATFVVTLPVQHPTQETMQWPNGEAPVQF